jgi:hypothetical protein
MMSNFELQTLFCSLCEIKTYSKAQEEEKEKNRSENVCEIVCFCDDYEIGWEVTRVFSILSNIQVYSIVV